MGKLKQIFCLWDPTFAEATPHLWGTLSGRNLDDSDTPTRGAIALATDKFSHR
jgi:hypothetical protein